MNTFIGQKQTRQTGRQSETDKQIKTMEQNGTETNIIAWTTFLSQWVYLYSFTISH